MEGLPREFGDGDGFEGQTVVVRRKRRPTRRLDLDDPRLEKARELAKAAHLALLRDGHQEGCQCNLSIASRLLLSALGTLGEVEAEVAKGKRAEKERKEGTKGKG